MRYEVVSTAKFRKDLKTAIKRGYNMALLDAVVSSVAVGEELPATNDDHSLKGNWVGYRECHITPDWILIYKIEDDILVLTLTRTGTHSDLF